MRGAGTIIPDAKINGPGLHVIDTLSGENSMVAWTYLCVQDVSYLIERGHQYFIPLVSSIYQVSMATVMG